jgi:hypothetical protein
LDLELHESELGGQCGKLGTGCNIVILLGEDADGVGGDFAVYYCLVLTDAKLLGWEVSKNFIIQFELVWSTLEPFWAEMFAVNECVA